MRLLPILFALLTCACAATPQNPAVEGLGGDDLWRGVDFSCSSDADCEIANLGNCCGYYPACVNRNSPTFAERVRAECESRGMSSVCGFPDLAGCTCIEGRCEGVAGGGGRLD